MKYTYSIVKSGYNFTLHSRDYRDEDGEPTNENPGVEFEVLDDKDYTDAGDFFDLMEEVTNLADNFDMVANAVVYITHHDLEEHNEANPELAELMDTVISMIVDWKMFEMADDYLFAMQRLVERLRSLE